MVDTPRRQKGGQERMNYLVLAIIILSAWFFVWIIGLCYIIFGVIMPKYRTIISDVSFQELLLALNAAINTEIELWEKDVFANKQAITNSNFENYYIDISDHIIKSLSPIFFINMGKYITEDAVITIIGRRVKEYLSGKVSGTV